MYRLIYGAVQCDYYVKRPAARQPPTAISFLSHPPYDRILSSRRISAAVPPARRTMPHCPATRPDLSTAPATGPTASPLPPRPKWPNRLLFRRPAAAAPFKPSRRCPIKFHLPPRRCRHASKEALKEQDRLLLGAGEAIRELRSRVLRRPQLLLAQHVCTMWQRGVPAGRGRRSTFRRSRP